MAKDKRIILGVTGSIAAYKSAEIIRRLREKSLSVTVVMTREAGQFITPLTLASLSGQKVYQSIFDDADTPWQMPHINLAKEASLLLIAPATANIIGKMACGLADDLLSCLALSIKAPILLAPVMNTEMYHNQIVQENCAKLKRLGMKFIDPVEGNLACGTTGDGHIASEETIVKAVLSSLR